MVGLLWAEAVQAWRDHPGSTHADLLERVARDVILSRGRALGVIPIG